MAGNQTTLLAAGNDRKNQNERNFTFDYSYWSHSGYKVEENGYCAPDLSSPDGSKYADQKKVFSDLGASILSNAWSGYNARQDFLSYCHEGISKKNLKNLQSLRLRANWLWQIIFDHRQRCEQRRCSNAM
jgi:hypothetical protein